MFCLFVVGVEPLTVVAPVTSDLGLAMVADPDLVPAIVIRDVAIQDQAPEIETGKGLIGNEAEVARGDEVAVERGSEVAALSDDTDLDPGTLNPYTTFLCLPNNILH